MLQAFTSGLLGSLMSSAFELILVFLHYWVVCITSNNHTDMSDHRYIIQGDGSLSI